MARKICETVIYEYTDRKEFEKDINSKAFKNSSWKLKQTFEVNGVLRAEMIKDYGSELEAVYIKKLNKSKTERGIFTADGTLIDTIPEMALPRENSKMYIKGKEYIALY